MFQHLRKICTNWIINCTTKDVGDIYKNTITNPTEIYGPDDNLKFIGRGNPNILVDTPTGWEIATDIYKTVPYEVWEVVLADWSLLRCADNHILITECGDEIYVKDCIPGTTRIKTKIGISTVTSVTNLQYNADMFDLTVDAEHHTYYTNSILSHNSQTSAAFLLWYAIFNEDKTILIASNKNSNALEMVSRIRYMYESVPEWIKPGITRDGWNKLSVAFTNKSKIFSTATSESSGRGLSISLLYCLGGGSTITVRDKITQEIKQVSLEELFQQLDQ